MEIRFHGRGGQGGVTCAKIIAAAYARLDKSVQTFGDYAGERSGAPVRAYTRVSDEPITNRNKVYRPDHLVVLDRNLLGPGVLEGLVEGGSLLVNTQEDCEDFSGDYDPFTVATVDATSIARKHGIGTRSVVIVNTTLAGAYARLHGIPLEILQETYRTLGFLSNFEAAREAFDRVGIRAPKGRRDGRAPPPAALPPVEALPDHLESPPTGLKTGTWGTQRPRYTENPAPCNAWCPAGNDVVGFVQALAREGAGAAAEILGRTTPLAGVCGRVCPAPCMEGCNRRELDGAVRIRGLERWISDRVPVAVSRAAEAAEVHRFAVLGSGPAGLGAAYELARRGQEVVLFEGEKELGGVLRTGIPEYRLPREILDREIGNILALGVEARTGTFLGKEKLPGLAREFDALILATGLQKLRGLEGDRLPGIEQGIRFLHGWNLGGDVELQGRVVVLGGGNTAMDCARSALRAGAAQVTIAYRRRREDMPAIPEEITEAAEEGVAFLLQRAPVGFEGRGRLQAVRLAEVEMGPPDGSGRQRPMVTDRVSSLACDHVLLALGQSADLGLLPGAWQLREGRIQEKRKALKVFAAGDLATGEGTVTHAIGHGRRAAGLAMKALGLGVEVFERPDRRKAVPAKDIRWDHFAPSPPDREGREPVETRTRSLVEVNRGLKSALEAHRCFSCGHCTRCDTCLVYCPEGIIRREGTSYEVDYRFCKGCGICVEECPRMAMEMTQQ